MWDVFILWSKWAALLTDDSGCVQFLCLASAVCCKLLCGFVCIFWAVFIPQTSCPQLHLQQQTSHPRLRGMFQYCRRIIVLLMQVLQKVMLKPVLLPWLSSVLSARVQVQSCLCETVSFINQNARNFELRLCRISSHRCQKWLAGQFDCYRYGCFVCVRVFDCCIC